MSSLLFDARNRQKYKWSQVWIYVLFVLQLAMLGLPLLSVWKTIDQERKTWETQAQMGQTLLPVHSMIVIVMVFSDPLREGRPYLEVSSAACTRSV